jgi:hypothetical protein
MPSKPNLQAVEFEQMILTHKGLRRWLGNRWVTRELGDEIG